MQQFNWQQINQLLEELVHTHRQKMINCAQCVLPYITPEDLLQPNDFIELESHPYFRYEEGVLSGILTVQTALFAQQAENK